MAADENRFLGLPVWKWDAIQGVVAAMGAVAVILGAAWALFEYTDRTEATRAQATLDLLDVWETRGYLAAYQSLDHRFQTVLATVPAADVDAARNDPEIAAVLYDKITARVLTDSTAQTEFDDLVYFFQRMHICVQAKLCSQSATNSFFDTTLDSFARTFAAPLAARAGGLPDFAQ